MVAADIRTEHVISFLHAPAPSQYGICGIREEASDSPHVSSQRTRGGVAGLQSIALEVGVRLSGSLTFFIGGVRVMPVRAILREKDARP